MSKNLMLSQISESTINELSVFARTNTALQVAKAIKDAELKKVVKASRDMVKVVSDIALYTDYDEADVCSAGRKHKIEYACDSVKVYNELYNPEAGMKTLETVMDCENYIKSISVMYAQQVKDTKKERAEAISNIVPDVAYDAYKEGLALADYSKKEKNRFSFNDVVARMLTAMGIDTTEISAINKFAKGITQWLGGKISNFELTEKKQGEFNTMLVYAIINRLEGKNIIRRTEQGFVKITKEEFKAMKTEAGANTEKTEPSTENTEAA